MYKRQENKEYTSEDEHVYMDENRNIMVPVSMLRDALNSSAHAVSYTHLIAVGAFIKIDIPLPMYTMHFTLQWFFVLMAGFLLGAKLASLLSLIHI